jgi:hypothetical protein
MERNMHHDIQKEKLIVFIKIRKKNNVWEAIDGSHSRRAIMKGFSALCHDSGNPFWEAWSVDVLKCSRPMHGQ